MAARLAVALFGLPRRAEPAMPVGWIGIDNHGSTGRMHGTGGKRGGQCANQKYFFHGNPFMASPFCPKPWRKELQSVTVRRDAPALILMGLCTQHYQLEN